MGKLGAEGKRRGVNDKNVTHQCPVVIISCFNEVPSELKATIAEWSPLYKITLVDGVSSPPPVISANFPEVTMLRYDKNSGQGAAIRTGLTTTLDSGAALFLTVYSRREHEVKIWV